MQSACVLDSSTCRGGIYLDPEEDKRACSARVCTIVSSLQGGGVHVDALEHVHGGEALFEGEIQSHRTR